jgi:hypothetical protein
VIFMKWRDIAASSHRSTLQKNNHFVKKDNL